MRYPRQTHILLKSSYYVNKDLDRKTFWSLSLLKISKTSAGKNIKGKSSKVKKMYQLQIFIMKRDKIMLMNQEYIFESTDLHIHFK